MTTLVPRGYGAFPFFQFTSPNQMISQNYNDRSTRQDTYFSPQYTSQQFYPPHSYRDKFAHAGNQFMSYFSQLDDRYRYEQYMRRLAKVEKQYAKLQKYGDPGPMYPQATIGLHNDPSVVYQYEKETKFVPIPVFINPNPGAYQYPQNLGFGGPSGNLTYPLGGGMNVLPKVRVIFVPTGPSSFQQPYTGPLEMPPFLYNRISQPLCSFPLPPPLPQLGSLPLTPAVQEMVVQRYSNPVAVLPFMQNWQAPQTMMSCYPQMLQYSQQPVAPMPTFQAQPAVQQSYIPSSMPALPCIPPAPPMPALPCIPPAPPMSALPCIPPAPPMSALSSIPPAPPTSALSCIPPAPPMLMSPSTSMQPVFSQQPTSIPVMSTNIPVVPPQILQQPYSQSLDYTYPSICRACPPAPPPLTIPVTGHCWVQHCAACHHVPISTDNPNTRPAGGRATPLLRQPTVPQYVPDQTVQQKVHNQAAAAAPVMIRPWLRKTPPLPPGAVLISDEYIDRKDYFSQRGYSKRKSRRHHGNTRPNKNRSTTITSTTISTATPTVVKGSRSISPKVEKKVQALPSAQETVDKSNNKRSETPSSYTSSELTVEHQNQRVSSSPKKETSIPPQLASEARNVNVTYTYQPQELTSVYLLNRYLKSSSEASTSVSNVETPTDASALSIKEDCKSPSFINEINSIKEEANSEKEDEKSIRPPSSLKQTKDKIIIIREILASSPSTMSTVSSNTAFSINNDRKTITNSN